VATPTSRVLHTAKHMSRRKARRGDAMLKHYLSISYAKALPLYLLRSRMATGDPRAERGERRCHAKASPLSSLLSTLSDLLSPLRSRMCYTSLSSTLSYVLYLSIPYARVCAIPLLSPMSYPLVCRVATCALPLLSPISSTSPISYSQASATRLPTARCVGRYVV
jgi:hypothetical protein